MKNSYGKASKIESKILKDLNISFISGIEKDFSSLSISEIADRLNYLRTIQSSIGILMAKLHEVNQNER